MITSHLTSSEIKKMINKEIKLIHESSPRKKPSYGRVLEIDRLSELDQNGCNWFVSAFMNITEYETEVLKAVEELKKSIYMID